ncbi:hypothetical protein BDK51DRAFT_38671 [Blyttiomyces helicus]|uniref:Response regulatory domain-containing protein n=1 Tax=Blyttiomyces helicus TaxID=388810 RepID=A0A4P9WIN7_9FUNG|nr:hypothetical protein BDK51DRAFT_38671 [Blyttiomyces helicus]|eukprot:RKO92654.1 hypothetical protein BDK51DRAFT_38671 [Blyttiomyces helicus]
MTQLANSLACFLDPANPKRIPAAAAPAAAPASSLSNPPIPTACPPASDVSDACPYALKLVQSVAESLTQMRTIIDNVNALSDIGPSAAMMRSVEQRAAFDIRSLIDRTCRGIRDARKGSNAVELLVSLRGLEEGDAAVGSGWGAGTWWPAKVRGYPVLLQQVIRSLLESAFRETQRGFVIFRVSVKQIIEPNGNNPQVALLFQIEDSGAGLPITVMNDVGREGIKAARDRNISSTYLSLSLVGSLVRLMGGELRVSSQLDQGTQVSFTLTLDVLKAEMSTNLNDAASSVTTASVPTLSGSSSFRNTSGSSSFRDLPEPSLISYRYSMLPGSLVEGQPPPVPPPLTGSPVAARRASHPVAARETWTPPPHPWAPASHPWTPASALWSERMHSGERRRRGLGLRAEEPMRNVVENAAEEDPGEAADGFGDDALAPASRVATISTELPSPPDVSIDPPAMRSRVGSNTSLSHIRLRMGSNTSLESATRPDALAADVSAPPPSPTTSKPPAPFERHPSTPPPPSPPRSPPSSPVDPAASPPQSTHALPSLPRTGTLPRHPSAPDTSPPASRLGTHPTKDRPIRVLVVEDNELIQALSEKMLVRAGFEVAVSSNGVEAIAKIEEVGARWFDVVLMVGSPLCRAYCGSVGGDLSMPVMDGFQATEAMRKRHWTLPIIALTSNDRARCMKVGFSYFMTKPFQLGDIATIIRFMVGNNEQQQPPPPAIRGISSLRIDTALPPQS